MNAYSSKTNRSLLYKFQEREEENDEKLVDSIVDLDI
jgi:hypothetical protein